MTAHISHHFVINQPVAQIKCGKIGRIRALVRKKNPDGIWKYQKPTPIFVAVLKTSLIKKG